MASPKNTGRTSQTPEAQNTCKKYASTALSARAEWALLPTLELQVV
jgi:hypothetical protein